MRPLHGIALKLGSVLVFIVMSSLIKITAQHVPPGQTVFFRSFFAIPVIVAWLALRRELATGFQAQNLFGHFWRGLMGTTAMGLGFAGLGAGWGDGGAVTAPDGGCGRCCLST